MIDLAILNTAFIWPMMLMLAWTVGEFGHRRTGLPRISLYALVGFVFALAQGTLLPQSSSDTLLLLANIAFGLLLFEAGHRINLHWLKINPWLGMTSLVEAGLTFVAVYLLAHSFQLSTTHSLLLATLALATSPATVLRVVNEQQSRGQVTERVLHLAVLNSIMAVFAFKIVVGVTMFKTLGAFWLALYDSVIVLSTSAALGALFGIGVPALLRAMRANHLDNTPAFALAIVVLVTFTHGLNLSPILAALIFGLVTRHRRITFNASQRGFGTLGDLLSVLLFVFIATSFKWRIVFAGIQLGLALIAVRFLAKTIGITCFAHLSGITWKKGLLISLAMTPMSAFVILLFEQTPHLGINFFEQLAPLATAALTMEILSPILMQCSLRWAKETRN